MTIISWRAGLLGPSSGFSPRIQESGRIIFQGARARRFQSHDEPRITPDGGYFADRIPLGDLRGCFAADVFDRSQLWIYGEPIAAESVSRRACSRWSAAGAGVGGAAL